jgi:prevent-host-death family protein
MSRVWQLQEAKNKLSEVVDRANAEGPQMISRRGKPVAVVLSAQEFRKNAPRDSLIEFFARSPLRGLDLDLDLDLERQPDYGRDVKL